MYIKYYKVFRRNDEKIRKGEMAFKANKIYPTIMIALLAGTLSSTLYADEYYVRSYLECSYSGDGTSRDCASSNGASGAWKGFSAISWGSDTNQIGSGDALHICGSHNEGLEIGASGLPDSELVITGSCFDTPGVINGGNSIAALNTMGNKYLHITNLELVGGEVAALNLTSDPKYSPVFVRVTNNTIHDPIVSETSGFGFCVKAIGSDILFSTNEIYSCSEDGIYIGGDRVEVAYSYIHDVDTSNALRGDCVKYTSIGLSSDGHVHHNLLDHSSNNIKKNALIIGSSGSGIIVEYNTIIGGRVALNIRNHSNAIVRYNKIIPKAPETTVWSSGIALENASNAFIYNNIIDASDAPTFALFSFGNSVSKLDNNIIVGDSIMSNIRLVNDTSTYLRGNTLGGVRVLSVATSAMLIESDYNWFIYDYPQSIIYDGMEYNSLSDYQINNTSLDQNSTTEDPMVTIDSDGDGVGDTADVFLLDPTERFDSDGDGVGDTADAYPFDPMETVDSDGDGAGDYTDNCPTVFNASQLDSDRDNIGDSCDAFPYDPFEALDTDADGIGDIADNCPAVANTSQADIDTDGRSDACDADNGGVPDLNDTFPLEQTKTDAESGVFSGAVSLLSLGLLGILGLVRRKV